MLALPISKSRFKALSFKQMQNLQNFQALGTPPQTPVPPAVAGGFAPRLPLASGSWGLRPQTP